MVAIKGVRDKLSLGCCWSCRQTLQPHEGNGFCQYCWADLPRLAPACLRWRCQQPEQAQGRYWLAALSFRGEVVQLLHRLKFQGDTALISHLAPLLAAQLLVSYQRLQQPLPVLLVAMPISRRRWWQRGYNQAARLAEQLAYWLDIPLQHGLLRKLGKHRAQHRSSAAERWQNMAQSIHCSAPVTGLRVAVVDDVLTTGASMSAAAQALLRRGAVSVDCWALAYTEPHPEVDDDATD